MKMKTLLLAVVLTASLQLNAQERSPFRNSYTRLGINKLGDPLDNSLSPKENVFEGRYGAGTGYVFEFGRVFYFLSKDQGRMFNVGLDWTYLSLNYNKMDGWDKYGAASGAADYYVDGTKTAAAISSKLGPVFSINPIEQLVIDARFQFAPTGRFFDLSYYEEDQNPDGRYFEFVNSQQEDMDENYDSEAIKNRIAFGVQTNFGITLRRKGIGLAIDYMTGSVKSNFEAQDTGGLSFGKEKIKAPGIQFKLSFSL